MEPQQEPRTFPEWQAKYITITRWAYVGGMTVMVVIGFIGGIAIGYAAGVIAR